LIRKNGDRSSSRSVAIFQVETAGLLFKVNLGTIESDTGYGRCKPERGHPSSTKPRP
jgi:hypothetical protein